MNDITFQECRTCFEVSQRNKKLCPNCKGSEFQGISFREKYKEIKTIKDAKNLIYLLSNSEATKLYQILTTAQNLIGLTIKDDCFIGLLQVSGKVKA